MNFDEIRVQIVCEMDLVLDQGLTTLETGKMRWGEDSSITLYLSSLSNDTHATATNSLGIEAQCRRHPHLEWGSLL